MPSLLVTPRRIRCLKWGSPYLELKKRIPASCRKHTSFDFDEMSHDLFVLSGTRDSKSLFLVLNTCANLLRTVAELGMRFVGRSESVVLESNDKA